MQMNRPREYSASPRGKMKDQDQILEINLISAQGLKPPSKSTRKMQTYAIAWIDASSKLRTQVDRIGGENPTWNDKFLFRVTSDFLASETSGVSVEIYNVGLLRDPVIGTVRFLISSLLPSSSSSSSQSPAAGAPPTSPTDTSGAIMTPFFTASQIRRPSGSFHGVLNVGAMVVNNPEFSAALTDVSAIGYRDLMGKRRARRGGMRKVKSMEFMAGSFPDENDSTDGGELTCSSATSSPTPHMKNWNRLRELAASNNNHVRSSSEGGMFSFLKQKKHGRSDSKSELGSPVKSRN